MRLSLSIVLGVWHVATFVHVSSTPYYSAAKNYKSSINIFATRSLRAIASDETGNFIYSPLGASMVLTMAAFSAGGITGWEMRRGLALPFNDVVTEDEIITIVTKLNSVQDYELRLASRIFSSGIWKPEEKFINITRSVFDAPARSVDFINPEGATQVINAWSSEETDGHIKEIIDPDFLSGDSQLLFLNVGYFNGIWRLPFISDQTRLRNFYVNRTIVHEVPTMFVSGFYRYGELREVNATFVELPYKVTPSGDALSMYVILPNENNGLPNLIRNFDKVHAYDLMRGSPQSIDIYLPKFKFEKSIALRKPLIRLGFRSMFTAKANFSGMTEEGPLAVSDVIQKIHIDINEDGDDPAVVSHHFMDGVIRDL